MIALLGLLTLTADAGVLLAGGLTGSPSSQGQVLTGVPTLRVGVGSQRFHVWTSARFARYTLETPNVSLMGLEPHLGLRLLFDDPIPGRVVPLATMSTYTRLWAIGGDDIQPEDVQPDRNTAIRPVIGTTAGAGLEAILTTNLAISAEFGVDYFTAGYVFDGWVSHLSTFTTYGALYVNLRL
jgi:hypothetical protein